MSKDTLVDHPEGMGNILIKEWYKQICTPAGKKTATCAAAILSKFEWWYVANKSKFDRGETTNCKSRVSLPYLKGQLFDEWSINTIRKAIDFLLEQKMISREQDEAWDKFEYEFHYKRVNEFSKAIKSDTPLPYYTSIKSDREGLSNLNGGSIKFARGGLSNLNDNNNNSIDTINKNNNHIDNRGDFSKKTENEGLDLKAKKPKKETRRGGGDGEAILSPDLKRLEVGKAVLASTTTKKGKKNDLEPISVEISEALEDFGMLEVWERWRTYRWRMHKFQYFDDKSEKDALNSLMQKARNQSDVAIELVELAINNGWKGFYLPKTTVQNGQQANQTGIKSTERIKSEFILDFNQRYGRQPNEDELAMAGAIYEGAIRG